MEQIGRYQVTSELGKGAMGVVYKALDPTIGREVALKTMRLDAAGMESEELLRRFRNEARAAGALSHPHIVTIYDAGEQEGLFYIAMEYIEGQTLQSLLAEKRVVPVEQMIAIAGQVCAGLDYAHARNVVHRDIKPANIMITAGGTAKIMDFGIAKAGGGMTSAGQVLGTPNYMSPEQVKGKPLDGRSDLFSMGVILYEMLTGEKPFTGQNVTTIIYKIVNENPIPPRELDVTVHPGLSAVVTKALAKAADERYQSGAELARDLQNYKSFGSTDEDTVVLDAGAYAAPPVAAAPAASSGVAAAPARVPGATAAIAALPRLESTAPPKRRTSALQVIVGVVLLAAAALGAGYYRHLATKRPLQAQTATPQPAPPSTSAEQTPAAAENKPELKVEPLALNAGAEANSGEAKPAAKPTTGELRLESSPAGASVQIDGRSVPGRITPVTVPRLTPGAHSVTFSKAGYVSEIRATDVVAGKQTTLEVELPPLRATLALASTPAGAQIVIDDKATGMLTPAELTVDKGNHTVVLRKPGFEDAGTVAKVSDGQRFSFAPALQRQRVDTARLRQWLSRQKGPKPGVPGAGQDRGFLEVRTLPKGVEVLVNGYPVPRRTPFRIPLSPGRYEVTLLLPGYQPLQKTVEVVKDKVAPVSEALAPR